MHGYPLRKLMRDYLVYEAISCTILSLHASNLPADFYCDMAMEFLRLKDPNSQELVQDTYNANLVHHVRDNDRCHYHQHDDKHPRCEMKALLDE